MDLPQLWEVLRKGGPGRASWETVWEALYENARPSIGGGPRTSVSSREGGSQMQRAGREGEPGPAAPSDRDGAAREDGPNILLLITTYLKMM